MEEPQDWSLGAHSEAVSGQLINSPSRLGDATMWSLENRPSYTRPFLKVKRPCRKKKKANFHLFGKACFGKPLVKGPRRLWQGFGGFCLSSSIRSTHTVRLLASCVAMETCAPPPDSPPLLLSSHTICPTTSAQLEALLGHRLWLMKHAGDHRRGTQAKQPSWSDSEVDNGPTSAQ